MATKQALKRSASSQLVKETSKRLRTHAEANLGPVPSGPSRIESLPTELLEQIFLQAANGNLLLAAPRIAVKLSGNETLYRTVFAMAFYNHQLSAFLSTLKVSSLIPCVDLPMRLWDIRSLTKAVLRSRWCTCGWTWSLLVQLLKNALTRVSENPPSEAVKDRISKALDVDYHYGDIPMYGYRSFSRPPSSCMMAMESLFDLNLRWSGTDDITLEELGYEFSNNLFHFEARFLQCPLNAVDHQLAFTSFDHFKEESPLRMYFEDFFKQTETRRYRKSEIWSPLDSVMDYGEEGAFDINLATGDWIRAWVAGDYFFYPEDYPYKLPPSAFRQAAIRDLREEYLDRDDLALYELSFVAQLFEIDPHSLPRDDPLLFRWAIRLREAVEEFPDLYQISRFDLRDLSREDDENLQLERREIRDNQIRSIWVHLVNLRILRYMISGELDDAAADGRGRDMHSINLSGNVTLPSGIHIPEEGDLADDSDYSTSIWENPLSKYGDLSFLGPNDFSRRGNEDRIHIEDVLMPETDRDFGASWGDPESEFLNERPAVVVNLAPFATDMVAMRFAGAGAFARDVDLSDVPPPNWYQPVTRSYLKALSAF